VYELNTVIEAHNAWLDPGSHKTPTLSEEDLKMAGYILVCVFCLVSLTLVIPIMQWVGWLSIYAAWSLRILTPIAAILTIATPILLANGHTKATLCDVLRYGGNECLHYCQRGPAFICAVVAGVLLLIGSIIAWLFMPVGRTDVEYDHLSYAAVDHSDVGFASSIPMQKPNAYPVASYGTEQP